MSVITVYDPAGIATAANSRIVVLPAVADLNAITVAEWNAGLAVECATEAFGTQTNVSMVSRKKLCDPVATQRPGDRTYEMSGELRLTLDDPQAADGLELMDKFALDDTVYLAHRPGLAHTDAAAADQRYEGLKAIVAGVDLAPISTEAGEEYEFVVQLAIQERTQVFGTIAA